MVISTGKLSKLSHFIFPQERALHYVDNINGDVKVGEGISLIQTEAIPEGRSLNEINLSENGEAREGQVDSLLADRIARFLGTHTLQFKVPKDSIEDMQRSLDEGNFHLFPIYTFDSRLHHNRNDNENDG